MKKTDGKWALLFLIISVPLIFWLTSSMEGMIPNNVMERLTLASDGKITSSKDLPDGIVPVEEYKDTLPQYVDSFRQNDEMVATTYGGSEPYSYLEKNPYLNTLYEGYIFSIQYDRARGHSYALEDVLGTKRPKAGASCLSCKTSEFETLFAENKGVAKENFEEFAAKHVSIGFTCFDCHGESPGVVKPQRVHLKNALAKNQAMKDSLPEKSLACAQCHVEYYLNPETKEVVLPWDEGVEAADMIAYYDKMDYKDFDHPTTGAHLIKIQHPETETFAGSVHASMGLDCATCHMPTVKVEGKPDMHSHHWTSPLKTAKESCLKCHSNSSEEDIIKRAEHLQAPVVEMTDEVGFALESFIKKVGQAIQAGTLKGDELEKIRTIHRHAQLYFDYVFVENSEGFHNQKKSLDNLTKAQELINEGMDLLESL